VKPSRWLVLLGAFALFAAVRAEDAPPAGETTRPRGPERGHRAGTPGHPEGEERPLAKWLERRKEQNPEEFERLRRLREENPGEFHRHLASRLGEQRARLALAKHPRIREALAGIPEEEQRAFFGEFFGPGFPSGDRERPGGDARPKPPEESRRDLPPETRDLVRRHREATDPETRQALAQELRLKLNAYYQRKLQERQGQLDRMEQELLRMRRELDEQARTREEAVWQRVEGLLGETPR
jgi:hypothetical protein